MEMKLSRNGLELIKQFEGLRLKAYKCLASERFYTIGYGHYGADVYEGMAITEAEAESMLMADCDKFVSHVNTYQNIYNFNQNEFDALVSFAYNVGNIRQLTQRGTRAKKDIPVHMIEYCKAGGVKLNGLVRRRNAEIELFNRPVVIKPVNLKDNNTIALEVIQGKWGNGNARKQRLTEAGYNYREIQSRVNEMLRI